MSYTIDTGAGSVVVHSQIGSYPFSLVRDSGWVPRQRLSLQTPLDATATTIVYLGAESKHRQLIVIFWTAAHFTDFITAANSGSTMALVINEASAGNVIVLQAQGDRVQDVTSAAVRSIWRCNVELIQTT